MADIDTIVFDVGNILLNWDPRGLFKKITGTDDWENHPLKSIIGDPHWLEMDRGVLSLRELAERYRNRYSDHYEEILAFLLQVGDTIEPMDGAFDVVKRCKQKGYRVLILSNFGEEAWHTVEKRFEEFGLFDGGIVSWRVKQIKPEAEIYQRLIADFTLDPARTLFIDDTLENIVGARNHGIKGLHLPLGDDLETRILEFVDI